MSRGRQRPEHSGDELRLLGTLPGVYRGGRIGQQDQVHRGLVDEQIAIVFHVFRWRRQQEHEIAVFAAAVRNQRQFRLLSFQLGDDFKIASGRVFLRVELDVRRVLGLGRPHGVRRRRDPRKRHDRIDLHGSIESLRRGCSRSMSLCRA